MSRRVQLILVLLAPLAVFAALIAVDRGAGAMGVRPGYVLRFDLPPAGGEIGLPPVQGPLDASRPLVVIDAGHGGHDPGAVRGSLREKDLTLALATALRDRLLAEGGIRVALTRADDRFLALGERSGMARRLQADLFISLHADSTVAEEGSAAGGTIYTLSERGSNEIATRLAVRENRADSINGVQLASASDSVSAILVDLSQREALARADSFARLLLREAKDSLAFRDAEPQSAAFGVLKSPDTPSVLFEAGYISNAADAARLASAEGQDSFAAVTARAIRVFFARQAAPPLGL